MNKGRLIVFSGPSGVGKNTVRRYFQHDPDLKLDFSISMTTRKIRPGEIDGKDYIFADADEFVKAIHNDELLEYAEFVGNYYGTPIPPVKKSLDSGRNVLLEIEVQGALQVMKKEADELSIFLVPPSIEELERRLKTRGTESEDKIRSRINKATVEMASAKEYDYIVVNDDPQRAAHEIKEIILKETK